MDRVCASFFWLLCSLLVTAATVLWPSWETGFIFKSFWVSSFAAAILEIVAPATEPTEL